MTRPVRLTVAIAVALVGLAWLLVSFASSAIHAPALTMALTLFCVGVNLRGVASVPIRVLDGVAVLAGGYSIALVAFSGGAASLPIALLVVVIAVASAAALMSRSKG